MPDEAGIFIVRGERLDKLEPNVYSRSKVGGMWKIPLTYGIAKGKFKAVLASAHANYQVSDPRPTFYFCFEVKRSGLSDAGQAYQPTTTSPNEFVLLRMESKKNAREVVVGEANAYSVEMGASEKSVCGFDFEKLEPGLYRVTPREPLAAGEYCFHYAGGGGAGYGVFWGGQKVFDFGVRADE